MIQHDVLKIPVTADRERIDMAYEERCAEIRSKYLDGKYESIAQKKLNELEQAHTACIIYLDGSVAQKATSEIRDMAQRAVSSDVANNCCPCGPVFLIGHFCCKDDYGYFHSGYNSSICCCDELGYTLCGVGDTLLWTIPFIIYGIYYDISKKRAEEEAVIKAKEAEERRRHALEQLPRLRDQRMNAQKKLEKANQALAEFETSITEIEKVRFLYSKIEETGSARELDSTALYSGIVAKRQILEKDINDCKVELAEIDAEINRLDSV